MLRNALAIVVLVACDEPVRVSDTPPPAWVYEPPPPSWQHGEVRGRFGRSQPLQRPRMAGVVGSTRVPLRRPTVWPVPGIGPARAVVHGFEGVKPAVELIDVEGGTQLWRETVTCAAPVAGVTSEVIVCGGTGGVRALGLDGKPRWKTDAALVAITGERVVVDEAGTAVTLDANTGERAASVKPPAPLTADMIVAACDAELFALGKDGRLVRIVAGKAKWSVLIGAAIEDLEPCDASVLVRTGDALIAIARETGKVTGKLDGVTGVWPARNDSGRLEIATRSEVLSWTRDLVGPAQPVELPPAGALLDARGDRRLVRVSEHAVALLDRHGVHSYVALAAERAVLGGTAILAGTASGSPGETVRRIALPERTRRVVRVPWRGRGVAVPAELRDLPEAGDLDLSRAIAKPDTGKHAIAAVAIDPREPATLYTVALEEEPGESTSGALASADLANRTWRWQRTDGCGTGIPVALALADRVVVCAARGVTGTVRATSRDGRSAWDLETDVDGLAGGGDTLLVHDANRLTVLSAATGRIRGRLASDDGAAMRAAVVPLGDTTWLVTYEAGKLVARIPAAGMLAAWSLAVDGHVATLSRSGAGVLVELADGDAYRIDVATAAITPLPGLDLAWHASGDLVTGHTAGGPIPGIPLPRVLRPPPRFPLVRRPPPRPPADDRNPDPPTLWVPIKPPPPLGESWQYTLYELDGGLRARNDYALAAPIVPATARGPQGSPLVVTYGVGLREVLVLDPRTGDPVKRVRLPDGGHAFATIVNGTPVAGALLAAPLRAVVF